jgi:hypothetical protein
MQDATESKKNFNFCQSGQVYGSESNNAAASFLRGFQFFWSKALPFTLCNWVLLKYISTRLTVITSHTLLRIFQNCLFELPVFWYTRDT